MTTQNVILALYGFLFGRVFYQYDRIEKRHARSWVYKAKAIYMSINQLLRNDHPRYAALLWASLQSIQVDRSHLSIDTCR